MQSSNVIAFPLPNFFRTLQLEHFLMNRPDSPNSNSTPGQPVPDSLFSRFRLDDFLAERKQDKAIEASDVFVVREIERMVAAGKYEMAYDMYTETAMGDTPEDFQDWLDTQVD